MTSPLSTLSVTGIEARTESDDNIMIDEGPIDLEPTTFANTPHTTGTTIPGISTETTLTISTSGTTSYITETLSTEIIKDTTELKDINETTTNIPYTAGNDGTEFVTQNTVSYTDTGSKNYSTTLDSDELVQSSSTIHVESTEKPYIKHNESTESSTQSTESKNTKNPENQRQLNNNYTETTQAIKLSTPSLHTTPDIDVTTNSKLYTTVPVLTTETTQVVTSQISKLTTKNEIDSETTVDMTTDNIITLTQTSESNTTKVVTAHNLEVTSSTEFKTASTESMSTASPSTIVHELSTTDNESDKFSTLQGDEGTETFTDNIQVHTIDTTTGMINLHIQKLTTRNEFSATTTKAEFTFDETLLSQTNSSPVSTTTTVEVIETEQIGLSTKSANAENESTTLPDLITKEEPEVTTQLHRNDITDHTTESTSFRHDYVGEFSDFTITDTSMFKTTTDAQHLTKLSMKPIFDTATTDSESATNPIVLKEVTGITSTDHVIQTSYDIKFDTSTQLKYTSEMEMSSNTFKYDITTLKSQAKTAGLDSLVTTENIIEARTTTSTRDDATSALRDIIARGSTGSSFNLQKTTETRKDSATTTSSYSDSLKKVTEIPNTEANSTEKDLVNQQSSSLWEDFQTSSQKTTLEMYDFEDKFSTQNNKETTRNIKDTVPFTKPTTQSQFSTYPVSDDHIVTISSRPKTTASISDSSTSNSFTNTIFIEAITSTSTSYTKSSQEDNTNKPYEISMPIVIETTTRENTDKYTEMNKDYISTMEEEVSASTSTTRPDTNTRDNFAQFTTSLGSQYSTATTDLDIVSDKSSIDLSGITFTQEISQTTPEVLVITSTTNDKSIQTLGSTSETITTHSPGWKHESTTGSNEVFTAGLSTSNIIVTESYPTNTVISVTSQNIDNQSTTLKLNENTENSSITTSTISSESDTTNTHSDTTPKPTPSTSIGIESTTEQFSGSQTLRQETVATAAAQTTTVSIDNNMPHDMDYTGTQFESTVDNVVIMTPSTSTTNIYNTSITEATTNIQEVTTETGMFIKTTQYESKSQDTFTPSTSTKNGYNTSVEEASTNTQETTPEIKLFTTSTQSESKPQATPTVHYSPVTSTPTVTQSFDTTTALITTAESIHKSPDASTSTENMLFRQKENVDISAWTDSTSTTDLTSTESDIQTTETVTNLKQCEVNSQCSVDKACLNGVCQNPCETARSVCTKSVACKVVNHTAVCVCDDAAGVYCVRGMHFLFAYHT